MSKQTDLNISLISFLRPDIEPIPRVSGGFLYSVLVKYPTASLAI